MNASPLNVPIVVNIFISLNNAGLTPRHHQHTRVLLFARAFWAKLGKKPPASTSTPAPATAVASTTGTIAVAAIRDRALVQNIPTPGIRAVKTGTHQVVSLLPDSGAGLTPIEAALGFCGRGGGI